MPESKRRSVSRSCRGESGSKGAKAVAGQLAASRARRQAEIGQPARQEVKGEHDRPWDVSRQVEPKPIPENTPKVEQEAKREAERRPNPNRREAHCEVNDLSRVKLPEINLKEYAEFLRAEKQGRQKEIAPTGRQEVKASCDMGGANQTKPEQKPSRDITPSPRQERTLEILQVAAPTPKVELKPQLANLPRVEQSPKRELPQSKRPEPKPEQEHPREKLLRPDREERQESLQPPKQEKKVEQATLQEKLPKQEQEKRQASLQPAKPKLIITPKQEKEVSPLIKQMSESRAKKLAHEILAESQQLKRQQEQSQAHGMGP